jgi:uncharacterized SAM-binding protein YcdF (DUF218 family)
MTEEALRLARIIWNYHRLDEAPVPAGVIVALGTNDLRVAEFAASLYLRGYAPTVLFSGGMAHPGDLLETHWEKTEAEMFAETAERRGVPAERILLETRAVNTAENLRFSRELLAARGIRPRNILIAVKPFMQRRTRATLAVEWPEMEAAVVSPDLTLDAYFTPELTPDKIVNIMIGDLQRLWVYAKRGWSAPQEIPAEVEEAYRRLIALGFTQHLLSAE